MKFKPSLLFSFVLQQATFLIVVFFLYSCGSDNEPDPVENKTLISATEVASYPVQLLQFGANQQGFAAISEQLQYDITIYKIEYLTTYLGANITASGLIGVPNTDEEVPTLSFQHGTIAAHADAPTESDEGIFYASFASLGYISLIPDFIGFGSSSDFLHPYYHAESTAECIIDMIRASEEFIIEKNLDSNGKLFLAGYSEGGYATMVTHQRIEEKYEDEFNLIASAPASGGYDLIGMKNYFVGLKFYNQPFYLAYLSLSYSKVYEWPTLLSNLFNELYASSIPSLFDGSKSGSQINAALTTDIEQFLTEDFRTNSNDSKYDLLNKELASNSPIAWQPTHPVYMYHGSADITVPYQNSVDTYDLLIDAGADKITFTTMDGATHSSGVAPFVVDFLSVFSELK
ncbi:MAG: lipase family protein [Reichenbachiella sp.]|uniref:alpha/beta hydrolase family protein n=1 Tax=Reichenbachiella sp. TaxID=2184521 RepID=UPI0029661DB3|nr:lipase family protein [Reichenbachiella sp.]MDW3211781.1 lipase family protein [Reichenbachiella sp.]